MSNYLKKISGTTLSNLYDANNCTILIYRTSAVTYLGSGICNIQVMQCDILDYLLLFVDITFGQRHILLCLQVKLCSKSVTATLSLQRHIATKCVSNDNLKIYPLLNKNECLTLLWTTVKQKTAQGSRCVIEPSASPSQRGGHVAEG